MLQDLIEAFHPQKPFSHRRQHLDVKWLRLHIRRKLFLDQCDQDPDDHVRILPFQEEEISAFVVQHHLFSPVDLVGIYNNIAF